MVAAEKRPVCSSRLLVCLSFFVVGRWFRSVLFRFVGALFWAGGAGGVAVAASVPNPLSPPPYLHPGLGPSLFFSCIDDDDDCVAHVMAMAMAMTMTGGVPGSRGR